MISMLGWKVLCRWNEEEYDCIAMGNTSSQLECLKHILLVIDALGKMKTLEIKDTTNFKFYKS